MNHQAELLAWAAAQHWSVGVVLFTAGLLYAFHGFRMFRFLLAVSSAIFGWFIGDMVGAVLNVGGLSPQVGLAGGLSLLAVRRDRTACLLMCGLTWAMCGAYLMLLFGVVPEITLVVVCLAGGFGAVFGHLTYRPMTVVLTVMHGVILLVLGFVTLAANIAPTVGTTFCHWASAQAVLLPLLMAMLFVTAYSYQSNARRGDIITGHK